MIHHGMDYETYAEIDAWRWSSIKLMHTHSPLHVRHTEDNPADGNTASRRVLRAMHACVLEPDVFAQEFVVYTEGRRDKRTKAYKAFLLEHDEWSVLTQEEYNLCVESARIILEHPIAGPLFKGGEGEVTLTWTDEASGLKCKGRMDYVGDALVDLKTLGTTNERLVSSMIAKMQFHGQLAHYQAGCEANGLHDLPAYIVSAEGKAPFDVSVHRLRSEGALYAGAALRNELMERLAKCVKDDHWPGRHTEIVETDVPEWAYPDPDDNLTVEGE